MFYQWLASWRRADESYKLPLSLKEVSFGVQWPQLRAPSEPLIASRLRVRRSRRRSQYRHDQAVIARYPKFGTQVATREVRHRECDEPSSLKAPILKPFQWVLSVVPVPRIHAAGS